MTVQEYIEGNHPFYHITPGSNRDSILQNGLQARRCNAICTVRSDNHTVWDTIIQSQLNFRAAESYIVIRLTPISHHITADVLAPDSVEEQTAPLHSYICIENIHITEDDIIENNYVTSRGGEIPQEEIVELTEYQRNPIPDISVLHAFV